MSLKAEIEAWVSALNAYEAQDFDKALSTFDSIADSSKIWFNIALIHATLGEHDQAVQAYSEATERDGFFAVAAFQSGVSHFLLGRYKEAHNDFDAAYNDMRGNLTIDYTQIGLEFRLYSCEILFNRGLSKLFSGREEAGLADLRLACEQKQTAEHSVIEEALEVKGDGYTVFSIPVGILFRPSDTKVRNLEARDYLGKAKLVAAVEQTDAFTGFTGSERRAIEQKRLERDDKMRAKPPGMERSNTMPSTMPTYNASDVVKAPLLRRRPTDATVSIKTGSDAIPFPLAGPKSAPAEPLRLSRRDTARERTGSGGGSPLMRGSKPIRPKMTTASVPSTPVMPSAGSDSGGSGYSSSPRNSSLAYSSPATTHSATSVGLMSPRKPSLPTIPQESESYMNIYESYSDRDQGEQAWQGEEAKRAEGQPDRKSPDMVKKWVNATSQSSGLSRSMSGARRPMRAPMVPNSAPVAPSPWRQARRHRYEEDHGYESDDRIKPKPLERIRLKLHYAGDVRGLSVDADMPFAELVDRIEAKFSQRGLKLRFKDEDDSFITMLDEGDWQCGVETARVAAQGKPESKLDIFVDSA